MPYKTFVFKFFLLPKNEEKGENKPIFALQLLSFCAAPKQFLLVDITHISKSLLSCCERS